MPLPPQSVFVEMMQCWQATVPGQLQNNPELLLGVLARADIISGTTQKALLEFFPVTENQMRVLFARLRKHGWIADLPAGSEADRRLTHVRTTKEAREAIARLNRGLAKALPPAQRAAASKTDLRRNTLARAIGSVYDAIPSQ
jgi:DNA-binding MarR family transcriptional regulator